MFFGQNRYTVLEVSGIDTGFNTGIAFPNSSSCYVICDKVVRNWKDIDVVKIFFLHSNIFDPTAPRPRLLRCAIKIPACGAISKTYHCQLFRPVLFCPGVILT